MLSFLVTLLPMVCVRAGLIKNDVYLSTCVCLMGNEHNIIAVPMAAFVAFLPRIASFGSAEIIQEHRKLIYIWFWTIL